jgi:hypothetical protein
MKRAQQAPSFAKETDLCAAFIAALPGGWTPYPETAGFDILLSRKADGFQIGVQAKIKLNAVALAQALEGWGWAYRAKGPDCRAILVPRDALVAGVYQLAAHLAVTVIRASKDPHWTRAQFQPALPDDRNRYSRDEDWHELCPTERLSLPDYVPDVAAGASAPVQLTEWKIKAIKIAIICEIRGFVTRADFKALHIDPRRWIDARWMVPCAEGFKDAGTFLKTQHPKVYEEIKAQASEWMPLAPLRKRVSA